MTNISAFNFVSAYPLFLEDSQIHCSSYNTEVGSYKIDIYIPNLPYITLFISVNNRSIIPLSCQYSIINNMIFYPDELVRWSPCIMHKVRGFTNFVNYLRISIRAWRDMYLKHSKDVHKTIVYS